MVKLILWEMDRSFYPREQEERMKLTMTFCGMVKQSVDEGKMKMWGMNPGGNHGFAVTDGDEKEILALVGQYIPHVKFRVEPMLSIEEVISAMETLQKQIK
jgi:hypothetical protein